MVVFKCAKYSVVFFNLLFLGLGAGLIAVGAYSFHTTNNDPNVLKIPHTTDLAIAAMSVGGVVALVSFCGCCGAGFEKRFMLGSYFFLLLVLIAAQVAIGVLAYEYSSTSQITDMVEKAWNKSDEATKQEIEKEFHCCGFDEQTPSTNCTEGNVTCKEKIVSVLQHRLRIVEIVGLTFGSFQVLGLLVSCCLFSAIGKRKTEEEERKRLMDAYTLNRNYQ